MDYYYFALIEVKAPMKYYKPLMLLTRLLSKNSRRKVVIDVPPYDKEKMHFVGTLSTSRRTPNQMTLHDPALCKAAYAAKIMPISGRFMILKSDKNFKNESKLFDGDLLETLTDIDNVLLTTFEAEKKNNPKLHDEDHKPTK